MTSGDMAGGGRIVVVAGATGRQGGAVARQLVADGWSVRGLTRDPTSAKAAALRGAGVDVVRADMADPAALATALAGAYGVYSVQNPMISGHDQEIAQGTNVAEAAAAIGVGHLVYGSAGVGRVTGIDQWDAKLQIAEHARGLGVPLTTVRPMAFMELMTDRGFYPQVSTWYHMPKVIGLDRPLPWISVGDLAVVVAAAFAKPQEFVGRDIPLAADVQTLGQCRATWQEVMGRSPRRFPMPRPIFERFVGKDTTRMWRWLHDNPVPVDVQETLAIHPGALPVREWLLAQRAG